MIHVSPINDKSDHCLFTMYCWCRPKVEWKGKVALVIHNAEDGRK